MAKKILDPRIGEYLLVNRESIVVERSPEVQRFADSTNVTVGDNVCIGFPELIGLEEILIDVLEERQPKFDLQAITRILENGDRLYFDLHIVSYQEEENSPPLLVVFFKDVTDRMGLEQTLVQATNELNILLGRLETTKDYLDKIIASMADALLVVSQSGHITRVNQSTLDLFGYQESQLLNEPLAKILDRNSDWEQLSGNQDFLGTEGLELVCKTKTGEKRIVAFSCSAIQSQREEGTGIKAASKDFVYIGRDITARKRTQQRQAAQHTANGILSESPRISEASVQILQGICESLEWDVGELWTLQKEELNPQNSEASLTSAEARDSAADSRRPQLRCIEIWSKPSLAIPKWKATLRQTVLTRSMGFPGWIWASGVPQWIADVVEDASFTRSLEADLEGLHAAFGFPIQSDGEVLGIMVFFSSEIRQPDEDLLQSMAAIGSQLGQFIQRKRAEAALLESEERYRDLFENANDLIQSVAVDGSFVYANRAWRETLGYDQAEIDRLNCLDIIHPDWKVRWLETFARVMSGEIIDRARVDFISKSGKVISVEGSINCKFVDGKPVATRAIFRDITERLATEKALQAEQKKAEHLLLNILPEPIADRLKENQRTIAEDFANVTVLFADIVGFTEMASSLTPIEVVELLNQIFSEFDKLTEKHSLEKIKTIGDSYMVVGGLPERRSDHAAAIANMALDMQEAMAQFNATHIKQCSIRIGIHSGPVVAGVIGIKKFIYDLWGDTVNTASRMESHGLPGAIQVSDSSYKLLQSQFLFVGRGKIKVKGKGEMTTYLLVGRKKD